MDVSTQAVKDARRCLCTYVHMCVCMYVWTYVCMYVCTYVCIYFSTHVRTYVPVYVCMYACMYVYTTYICTYYVRTCVRTHVYMHVHLRVCIYVLMYVFTYVGMYVCMYMCIYTECSVIAIHRQNIDVTKYIYLRSWTITEIMTLEQCDLTADPHAVHFWHGVLIRSLRMSFLEPPGHAATMCCVSTCIVMKLLLVFLTLCLYDSHLLTRY
jgi:hypothetical protein